MLATRLYTETSSTFWLDASYMVCHSFDTRYLRGFHSPDGSTPRLECCKDEVPIGLWAPQVSESRESRGFLDAFKPWAWARRCLGRFGASPYAQAMPGRAVDAISVGPQCSYSILHEAAHILEGFEDEDRVIARQRQLASGLSEEWWTTAASEAIKRWMSEPISNDAALEIYRNSTVV